MKLVSTMRFCFFILFYFICLFPSEVVHILKTPDCSPSEVIAYKAGIRPFRQNGIRLEIEYYKNKTIIHNYGYGGAGLTLSWGGAFKAVELMLSNVQTKNSPIAILGSGVIGLSTAHLLVDMGYHVTIYAEHFPPNTTSNIAGGSWKPISVPPGNDKELFYDLQRISYNFFDELAKNSHPKFGGVSKIDFFCFNNQFIDFAPDLPLETSNVQVHFDTGKIKNGVLYKTFLMDGSIYVQDLYNKAFKRGIQFVQKKFNTVEEILSLDETIIFNCTSIGSRELFNDSNFIPIKGQIIHLKKHPQVNYLASGPHNDNDFYLIPNKDKVIVGGTFEKGNETTFIDNELCQKILTNAHDFFCNN